MMQEILIKCDMDNKTNRMFKFIGCIILLNILFDIISCVILNLPEKYMLYSKLTTLLFIIFEYLVLPVEKINFAIEDKTIFIVGAFCFAFSIFLYFHSEKTSSVFYLMYIIVTPGIWLMQFFFQRIISIKINAISIWNTVYLEKAVEYQKKYKGIDENLLKHISPLNWSHINFLGEYSFQSNMALGLNEYRPLKV